MKTCALLMGVVVLSINSARSADVLAPTKERFAGNTTETPDFQRHVMPLLGK